MTAKAMIADLMRCFSPPPQAMQEKMERLAESIPEDARQDVIDKIIESKDASKKLSAKDIVEACDNLGVSYKATHYLPAEDWICDGCGYQFKYHSAPTDDDKIDKGIYDFCPMCGLQPGMTILAQQYNSHGIKTPWYDRLIEKSKAWGPKVPRVTTKTSMGGQYPVGGIFWSRAEAERERKEAKRIAIDTQMASLDGHAKRL